jgi:hypothetical protein
MADRVIRVMQLRPGRIGNILFILFMSSKIGHENIVDENDWHNLVFNIDEKTFSSKDLHLNYVSKCIYDYIVEKIVKNIIIGKNDTFEYHKIITGAYQILLSYNPDLSLKNECCDNPIQVMQLYYKTMINYINQTIEKYPEHKQNIINVVTPIINAYHDSIYMMSPNNQILLNQTLKSAKMGGNAQMLILEYIIGDEKLAADIVVKNKSICALIPEFLS